MIELKTPGELAAMRESGRLVAQVLAAVRERARPGTRLTELDALAHDVLAAAGAASSFLGYHPSWAPTPYPGALCTSVNDAVVHGPPTGYRLRPGDLLSVDFAAVLDGWHADAAISFVVGAHDDADPADLRLVADTERALAAGVAAIRPGARLSDISHAIGQVAEAAGYGQPDDVGGHGIGRHMHEMPHLANFGPPGRGPRLRPGLVLAIEPMLLAGGHQTRTGPDGWTMFTKDGARAAHVEHTVAVMADGPKILTLP